MNIPIEKLSKTSGETKSRNNISLFIIQKCSNNGIFFNNGLKMKLALNDVHSSVTEWVFTELLVE